MPFRTASSHSVKVSDPILTIHEKDYGPSDPVTSWDYVAKLQITSEIYVDADQVLQSTGLPSIEYLTATVQVDCVRTGYRNVVTKAVQANTSIEVVVEVPPHAVAHEIEVRSGLTLSRSLSSNDLSVASRKGSRLFWEETRSSFTLEGNSGGFPIEAFDFSKVGFPESAAWKLKFDSADLEQPYMSAVRLYVNTSHPRALEILSGEPGLVKSIVFHGILEQLLLTVADEETTANMTFAKGTAGSVLDHLSQYYLGLTLTETINRVHLDRSAFLARLQATAGFLQGGN